MTRNSKMKVLVTGGAGYVGSVLVPKILACGHEVTVYDTFFFGEQSLPHHDSLLKVKGDIRDSDTMESVARGHDVIIHLACISNDPSFALDPRLSREINYECFEPMVRSVKAAGVQRFIYASTSSVYGVSEEPNVTEQHPLVPLTDYNRYKGMTEPILLDYTSENFTPVIIRPATICGYSTRMRLDLSVNILTNHAVNNGTITVFGGSQRRPNIHIEDITDLYVSLLEEEKSRIEGETFNAGHENHSLSELAIIVKSVVEQELPEREPLSIKTTTSDDLRSYHISSKKIEERLGFRPKRRIEDAVRDICRAFKDGLLPKSLTDSNYYNVRRLQELVQQRKLTVSTC